MRDRRSLDILSVKKEAKLSASEVNDVEVVGRGHADLHIGRKSKRTLHQNEYKMQYKVKSKSEYNTQI